MIKNQLRRQDGMAHPELILALVLVIGLGYVAFLRLQAPQTDSSAAPKTSSISQDNSDHVLQMLQTDSAGQDQSDVAAPNQGADNAN
jgi:hypothetical protein